MELYIILFKSVIERFYIYKRMIANFNPIDKYLDIVLGFLHEIFIIFINRRNKDLE